MFFGFFLTVTVPWINLIEYDTATMQSLSLVIMILNSWSKTTITFSSTNKLCQQLWKTQQWPQDWKRSVFIPIPKKSNTKECLNYRRIALISHASKVMLKILQARLQQSVNHELPDVQAGFRKGRGTRDHIANIHWIIEKAREFQKKHLLLLY